MSKSVAERLTMNDMLDSYSGNFGDCCICNGCFVICQQNIDILQKPAASIITIEEPH
jgi:hypothetical protein